MGIPARICALASRVESISVVYGMVVSDKRRIFSWGCFDFANSAFGTLVLTFIYNTYYTQKIASDSNEGSAQWGQTVAIASIVIAILSPTFGAAADAFGLKKRFLFVSISVACFATAALYFPREGDTLLALFLFGIALVATEMSIVFNNAFLPEIAPKEKHGKVSGLAFAWGYAGGLICLFVAMFGFVPETGELWFGLSREGEQNVRATNVLVAVWFAVFSIPMLLWVKERKAVQSSEGLGTVVKLSFARLGETFHHMREYKQLFWLLIARLFYNDGLVAIFTFGGIYASVVFGFTMQDLMMFGVVLSVFSMLGAFATSFIEDRIGSRSMIAITLLGLIAASGAAVFIESRSSFWACAVAIGLFIGPNQSASRAYLSRLTPPEKANEFFGFYAFSGKATAFLGPLAYGWLATHFDSQRVGMVTIPVLLLVGFCILMMKTQSDLPKRKTS